MIFDRFLFATPKFYLGLGVNFNFLRTSPSLYQITYRKLRPGWAGARKLRPGWAGAEDNKRDSVSEWRPRLLRLTLTWSCVCAISPLTLHAAIMCQLLMSQFTVFAHSSLPSHALGAQFPSFICTALIPRIHVHYRFDVVHTPL